LENDNEMTMGVIIS